MAAKNTTNKETQPEKEKIPKAPKLKKPKKEKDKKTEELEKPKAPELPSPFDIFKKMFVRDGVFERYGQNPLIFSKNQFMVNRTCAIKYPLQAQYFNIKGVCPRDVILSWRLFLCKKHGFGKPPVFIYTKGNKAINREKEKQSEHPVFSNELIKAYCEFFNYELKDYNDMLEFFPEQTIEHIKLFEQTVINIKENIEKEEI